jgi:aspartate/methionine/tyrosine aminotransferase
LAVEAGHITLTCGATEARFVAVQRLLDEGAALAAPAAADAVTGAVLTRGGRMTDDLAQASVLYLTASMSEESIMASLRAAPEDGIVVYEIDDARATFHPDAIPDFTGRIVTIGEIGIDHGLVGARLGYLAAPSGVAASLRDFKQALTICSTNLSQWAALAVVEDL